jgi:hypothetical protein
MPTLKNKLTVSELKKELKTLNQSQLITIISEAYKLNDEVKQFLSAKFLGKETMIELFEYYKKAIEDEFFPDRGFGKMRLAQAKKAISTFKKITGDELFTLELMLFYVETGVEFTNTYGDINEPFYISMESMYEKVVAKCNENETIYKKYKNRLEAVVNDTSGIGWGFHDELSGIYGTIVWEVDSF